MADYVIRNGTVVDGSGAPGFRADVVVEGDRITAVERIGQIKIDPNGCRTINAAGKIVCPGIIDSHSHADLTIYRGNHAQTLEPLIRQGITTFIGGNCGMSMAPLSERHPAEVKMYLEGFTARELDEEITWKDSAGFMDQLDKNGVAMNCALLAPHGLIRIDAMGMQPSHANNEQIGLMSRRLEESMEAGCVGMSTGLQYMPGLQSDTRELVKLGAVLKKYEGIYVSHLRTYMNELPKAVDELAEVARENDIRAQISHMFWVPDLGPIGPLVHGFARFFINLSKYWTLPAKLDSAIEKELDRITGFSKKGVSVGVDVMPTTTTFTHLMAYFPPWVLQGSKEDIGRRLTNPRYRRRILRDIENGDMAWPHTGRNSWSLNIFKLLGWQSTRIMSVFSRKNKHLEGRTFADIAEERGKHPFDVICDILAEEDARVLVFSSLGEPEDNFTEQSIYAALKHPDVAISTDTILLGLGKPSHLFYGAYPKFFSRYVREKKMLSIEAAVRKTSGLPAEHYRLKDRGFIKKGGFADVLIFDPKTIAPNCDFCNPQGTPSGIEHVFINGHHAVEKGKIDLSMMPGRVLRRG
ncbi:MAG: D-aminoacylase [bacterium]